MGSFQHSVQVTLVLTRGKVKRELRIQIYELQVQIHELRVQIDELRVHIDELGD